MVQTPKKCLKIVFINKKKITNIKELCIIIELIVYLPIIFLHCELKNSPETSPYIFSGYTSYCNKI